MNLLDSNILIYSSKDEYAFLRDYITGETGISSVSVATVIEVLGYHRLNPRDKAYFESCFALLTIFEIDQPITEKAVALRQQQKLSLGDSIIAATALVKGCQLITHNVSDFENIEGLSIIDPLEVR